MDSLILHTRKGVLSTKLIPIHLPQKHPHYEQSQRYGHVLFQFDKTVIGDELQEEMAHMFADLFLIEMFQTTIAGVIEK